MALAKCKGEIVKALGRELTTREEQIVHRRASELKARIDRANNDPTAVTGILQQYADEAAARANAAKRATALNYIAFAREKAWRESVEPVVKNAGEVHLATFRGSPRAFEGSKDGAHLLAQHEMNARSQALVKNLVQDGTSDYAFDRTNNLSIGRAMADLRKGANEGALTTKYGKLAAKSAMALENAREDLRLRLNSAGAWIAKNSDAIFRRSHDAVKIARAGGHLYDSPEAKAYWVDSVNKKLDWTKSFDGELSSASDGARKKVLGDLHSQFAAGSHLQGESAGYGVGPASTAKRWSHARQLAFKSADDEVAYLEEFGRGHSITENVLHELRSGGKDLALMHKFGPNWQDTVERLYQDRREALLRDGGQAKQVTALEKAHGILKNNDFRILTGQAGHPADNAIARWGQAGRVWTSAAAIMNSIWTLTGDNVIRASMVAQRSGGSVTSKVFANYMHWIFGEGLSKTEKLALATNMGVRLEGITMPLDPYLGEHLPEGAASKFMQLTTKYGLHNGAVNRVRTNALVADSHHYWQMGGKAMKDLPAGESGWLKQYGIDEKSWDILRKQSATDIGNGNKAFTPDGIKAMDPKKFASLVDSKAPTDAQLARAQQVLYERYRNLLGEMADRSTVSPSLALQAHMGLGYAAVSSGAGGAAWRGALALKGFVINYLHGHMARELHGYNPEYRTNTQALMDAVTGKNMPAARGLSKLMVAGLLNFYVVNALRDVAMGKTPLDPFDFDSRKHGSFWDTPGFAAFTKAFGKQSLGLYGDVIFSQGKGPDQGWLAKVAEAGTGPEGGLAFDTADELTSLLRHMGKSGGPDRKQLGKDAERLFGTGWREVPGTQLPFAKWATDHFLHDEIAETLNPGYKQRVQQRMKQQGQTYLMGGP